MNALESPAAVSKSPRRRTAKASPPRVEPKTKTAVHLSSEAFRRLGIACVMEGRTQSELVESLIMAGLKHYVVSVRNGRLDDIDLTPGISVA
jgi:hypothetical protein